MKKLITTTALLLATSVYAAAAKPAKSVDRFITGELGSLHVNAAAKAETPQWGEAARDFILSKTTDLGGKGTEDFSVRGILADDETNLMHVRLDQSLAGLRVYGGEMIVHADLATGAVKGMNGRFLPDSDLPRQAKMNAGRAIDRAVTSMGLPSYFVVDAPELAYILNEDGVASLAWKRTISYESVEGPERDIIFADASNGRLVARHPQIHRAKSWKTYSANNGVSLPGTLKRTNADAANADAVVNDAHNNAGTTWDYYYNRHGRDSYNGAGATITSTVHYSTSYNNAFWNGTQMVYGDGNGTTFSPLGKSLDVVAHEITHAVTERTAGLVYQNESGALNEAMSDVFGASTEYYKNSASANVWKIGDEIYTPGTAGDALRYMNNPTQDGSSKDYYPERYVGTADYGGVHWNSGIANLAFYLLSKGGTHPRGKTTINVAAVGIPVAEKIFYRALTGYMTSSTNFAGARTATLNAAVALGYASGSATHTAVGNAWAAVGVGGGTPPPTGCTTANGSLSGTGATQYEPLVGANRYYYSAGSGTHSANMTGTGADFDLYLQKWNGSAWAQVKASEGATSTESISYAGTAGYYRYRVYSYSGSGSYSLCYSKPN